MASVPSRLLLPFGVFISLFVFTSADDYLIATTGNCTDSPHMPFWAWSKQPVSFVLIFSTFCTSFDGGKQSTSVKSRHAVLLPRGSRLPSVWLSACSGIGTSGPYPGQNPRRGKTF